MGEVSCLGSITDDSAGLSELKVAGAHVPLGPHGWLSNPLDWNRDVARAMARLEGLELTPDHWVVINAMRDYYLEFNVAPLPGLLKRCLRDRPQGQLFDEERLAALFPGGLTHQGSRLAGLQEPQL